MFIDIPLWFTPGLGLALFVAGILSFIASFIWFVKTLYGNVLESPEDIKVKSQKIINPASAGSVVDVPVKGISTTKDTSGDMTFDHITDEDPVGSKTEAIREQTELLDDKTELMTELMDGKTELMTELMEKQN